MSETAMNNASHQPIEAVLNNINAVNANSFESDGDRSRALLSAYALVSRLETPWDAISRLCMNQVSINLFALSDTWNNG